jgi:hypothetical protein
VQDDMDNCMSDANSDQLDLDSDGIGMNQQLYNNEVKNI